MKFLHVGCGYNDKTNTTDLFNTNDWDEVRLDIDESVNPDIVSSITDMNVVQDKSFNAVYSAHNIEHLFAHEVPLALSEFRRVLTDDGFVFIRCPDLYTIAQHIVDGNVGKAMYESQAGPVTPIDALYGMRPFLVNNHYMAHKSGFTAELLTGTLKHNNFSNAVCVRSIKAVELFCLASVLPVSDDDLMEHLKLHISSRLGKTGIQNN